MKVIVRLFLDNPASFPDDFRRRLA